MRPINFVTLAEKCAKTWQQWLTSDPSSLFMLLNNLYIPL